MAATILHVNNNNRSQFRTPETNTSTTKYKGLHIDAKADIVIKVYLGFDPLSDDQLKEAKKAIEVLEQYGVVAVLEPVMASWMHSGSIGIISDDLPAVVINGHVISFGRLVYAQEIVDAALAFLGDTASEEPPIVHGTLSPGEFLSAVAG